MSPRPRLTIFTPAFNRRHTLCRLYSSLLCQEHNSFEWLVIDDGSADETRDSTESFLQQSEIQIRYYQENTGKQAAWNRALDLARGCYFCCVDSDDAIVGNPLEPAIQICDHVLDRDQSCIGVRFSRLEVRHDRIRLTGQALFEGKQSYFDELASRLCEERLDIFVTKNAKMIKFPTEPNAKFIPEIWLYIHCAVYVYEAFTVELFCGNIIRITLD